MKIFGLPVFGVNLTVGMSVGISGFKSGYRANKQSPRRVS